jgi:DNA-binding NtrC family response regulator
MKVLVVDDDANVRKGLATFLGLSGHGATAVGGLEAARKALAGNSRGGGEEAFGAALVDVFIGDENGAELLEWIAAEGIELQVIMMSGRGSIQDAVAAVRKGAYDFLEKPLDTERLLGLLRNIERESAARRRLDAFRGGWLAEHVYMEEGGALAAVFESARRAAASPLSILVTGPTGSGKELMARWIHLCSPRSQGPFVAVNCAAIPPELAASSFFGSRKGAYTGAESDRQGYFEAASGGTLFLDEVGEIAAPLQASLLRAVEAGEIQPVGSDSTRKVDLRIVAATNRELAAESDAGRFRADLYWRLAQTTLALPPLSERRPEIRGLARFLAAPIRAGMGRAAPELGEGALAYLEARPWPGNVRELRAFIERALWLAPEGALLGAADFEALDGPRSASAAPMTGLAEAKEAFERAYVARVLEEAGGSVARAAERLGLLPNNLSRKLKELGLR